jgi:4-methylaminobutanoate oxidase (formaldehyde-forming)
LAFTCAWNKPGGFIGREALLSLREKPQIRRLVQFLLQDPEPLLYHNEPILRDGNRVGFITSGMYGHTLGGAVGLGYVNEASGVSDDFIRNGRFEILIGNDRVPVHASLRSLFDPDGMRPRS